MNNRIIKTLVFLILTIVFCSTIVFSAFGINLHDTNLKPADANVVHYARRSSDFEGGVNIDYFGPTKTGPLEGDIAEAGIGNRIGGIKSITCGENTYVRYYHKEHQNLNNYGSESNAIAGGSTKATATGYYAHKYAGYTASEDYSLIYNDVVTMDFEFTSDRYLDYKLNVTDNKTGVPAYADMTFAFFARYYNASNALTIFNVIPIRVAPDDIANPTAFYIIDYTTKEKLYELPSESGVWTHITYVLDVDSSVNYSDGSVGAYDKNRKNEISSLNFSKSKLHVYINGEYAVTSAPFTTAVDSLSSFYNKNVELFGADQIRIQSSSYYSTSSACGIVDTDFSIAFDNVSVNYYKNGSAGALQSNLKSSPTTPLWCSDNAVYYGAYQIPTPNVPYMIVDGVNYYIESAARNAIKPNSVITLTSDYVGTYNITHGITVNTNGYEFNYSANEYVVIRNGNTYVFTPKTSESKATVVWDPDNEIGLKNSGYVSYGSLPSTSAVSSGDEIYYERDIITFLGWSYTKGATTPDTLLQITEKDLSDGLELYPVYTKIRDCAYTITTASGDITEYFDFSKFGSNFKNAASGSTITLYSDVEIEASISLLKYNTYYFDLNGHYISTTNYTGAKPSTISLAESSKLYVYSSRPGGKIYNSAVVPDSTTIYGHSVFGLAKNSEVSIGKYGSFNGDNVAVYTSLLADIYSNAKLNVDGGQYFRTGSNSAALIVCRTDCTVNVKNAVLGTSNSSIIFSTYGVESAAVNFTVEKSLLYTKGYVFNEICSGANVKLIDSYIVGKPVCRNDKYTGYTLDFTRCRLDDSSYDIAGAEIVKTFERKQFDIYINTFVYDDLGDGVFAINPSSYDPAKIHLEVCFEYSTASDNDYSTIKWCYADKVVEEKWLNGITPIPPIALPEGNNICRFVWPTISKASGDVTYAAYQRASFSVMTNLTLYSDFVYNIYIPQSVADFIGSVELDGEAIDLSDLVSVNGVKYYRVQYAIKAALGAEEFILTLRVLNLDGDSFDQIYKLSIPTYANLVLNSGYSNTTDDLMNATLAYIKSACNYFGTDFGEIGEVENGPVILGVKEETPPPKISSIISGACLALDGETKFRFFAGAGAENTTVTFKYKNKGSYVSVAVSAEDWLRDADGGYYYDISLRASDLCEPINISVGGASFDYSLANYIYFINSSDAFERVSELRVLLNNLWAYSTAAAKYTNETPVVELTIADTPIENYPIIADSEKELLAAKAIAKAVYDKTGVSLEIVSYAERGIIVEVVDVSLLAFDCAAYVIDGNLRISSSFASFLSSATNQFIAEYIDPLVGDYDFCEGFFVSYGTDKIYYSDFGATGDGVENDFVAIRNAHVFANSEKRYTVCADPGKTFRISSMIVDGTSKYIPVQTNTDFTGAKIIFDDRHVDRNAADAGHIYRITPTYSKYTINAAGNSVLSSINKNGGIDRNEFTKLDLGLGYKALVVIYNANHINYIRYGGDANNGTAQKELVLIDEYGNIDPTTPLLQDYEEVTKVEILRVDEESITIKGGYFETLFSEYNIGTKSLYISRGIQVSRSNVILDGLYHVVTGEFTPEQQANGINGVAYNGFVAITENTGARIKNCVFTARRYYAIAGTYDINANMANDLSFVNCTQTNFFKPDGSLSLTASTVTNKQEYWGVAGTNYCKNMVYDSSELTRYDAHSGMYNGKIVNCKISTITLTGGGDMLIENTTIYASGSSIITLRNDYGSTWNGNLTIKDTHVINSSSSVTLINSKWNNHNFGYICYFPNVLVDNLTFAKSGTTVAISSNFTESNLHLPTLSSGAQNINKYVPPKEIKVINNHGGYKYTLSSVPFFSTTNVSSNITRN